MANRISMVKVNEIVILWKYGFSQRKVARKLQRTRRQVSDNEQGREREIMIETLIGVDSQRTTEKIQAVLQKALAEAGVNSEADGQDNSSQPESA